MVRTVLKNFQNVFPVQQKRCKVFEHKSIFERYSERVGFIKKN